MAIVKALRRLASGGFGLIASTDQIACDAGAMTVTPAGGTQQTVPAAIAGRVAADPNGLLSTSKIGFGVVNRVLNAGLSMGMLGYGLLANNTGISNITIKVISGSWAPTGESALQIYVPGTMPSGTTVIVRAENVRPDGSSEAYWPVNELGVCEFSVGASMHRGNGCVFINWVNSSGNEFLQDQGTVVVSNGADGGPISRFPRSRLLVTAPPGAVGARLLLALTGTGGSETNAFFSNIMFAQGFAGQSEASPYVEPAAKTLLGANLLRGSVPATALFAPSRGQFFRALESSSAGRVATVTDAVPSDRGHATNIAFNHTTFVTRTGPLAQFVKTTLGISDEELSAIIALAWTLAE